MASGSSAGGVCLLACLGLIFVTPCRGIRPLGGKETKYHVLRFFGAKPKPPTDLLHRAIDAAADRHGIKRSVFRALVKVESGGNHLAVSRVGARGLGQIMIPNAKRCGLRPEQLWDALLNLNCSAQILREEIDRVGDLRRALSVYNAGKPDHPAGQQYATKVLTLAERLFS